VADRTPRIGTGFVWVDAPCPECGALVEILAAVRSVLTVPQDDAATIRLRLKAKAVDHDCRTVPDPVLFGTSGLRITEPDDPDA
jgi:hypothetical protein